MNVSFKRICLRLHLWLGLLSGFFVMIICLTGGLYAFKDEIEDVLQPWKFVNIEKKTFLLPNELIAIADKASGESCPLAITYGEMFDAVKVDYQNSQGDFKSVYLNPYRGDVVKVTTHHKNDFNFFQFIMKGHLSLWLPRKIGSPLVSYSVLIFFLVLLTGVIVWLPRKWNRPSLKNRLTLKKPFKVSRLVWDLHNVIGFYALLPLFVLCLTGMIFGLGWFSRSVYGLVSGGKSMQQYELPLSDTLHVDTTKTASLDKLYTLVRREDPKAKNYYFTIPETSTDVYRVSVVHERGSYYRTDNLYFDRYTLAPLEGKGPYAGKYRQATAADRLMRMNLDIHDGRMWGICGKMVMCLASLVGASLPVTGYLLWRKKNRKYK